MSFGPRSRIVGIDDAPFVRRTGARVPLIGVLMSGWRVHGVMRSQIVRDGFGATARMIAMLRSGRFANHAPAVVLDGIAVGGFNIVDLPTLAESVGVPVIAVMRHRPNFDAIRQALNKTRQAERRWRTMMRAGEIFESNTLFFQVAGASDREARTILAHASEHGGYPEALRIAHLIGGALQKGTSRGGA
jgi:hypothetical protein